MIHIYHRRCSGWNIKAIIVERIRNNAYCFYYLRLFGKKEPNDIGVWHVKYKAKAEPLT